MSMMCARCDLAPPAGTAAGAPCARCGTPLVADPVGDPAGDPFSNPAHLDLVGLDERADAPLLPRARAVEPPAPPPATASRRRRSAAPAAAFR
ncbi:MAG: hypothetical protein M3680_06400 [Myxococcota bacterium]|nr:hypothetical protein [Myxococcota bacterium]